MKRRVSSFFAGFAAAVLLLALCTTALAASGKVSYNFANVALDGETKITAGADITAANGQKVPGTILFTDAAGGKTNYLPIRAVSELLGVEIGYDSATRTVLLGDQPAEEPASTAETVSGRQWQRELDPTNGGIYYTWPKPKEVRDYDALPTIRPTWLPEGYQLERVEEDSRFIHGVYAGKGGERLLITATPSSGSSVMLDRQGAEVTQTEIGTRGAFIAKRASDQRIVVLMFDNSYAYTLTGYLPQEDAIAIMESIPGAG